MLITTERLFLRVLRESDVTPAYVNALNDPEVVRFTEARHVRWTREAVLDYVRRSNQDGVSQLLGIFLKDSGRHIGNIRLFNFSEAPKRVELSILIFDKAQWSKRYVADAVTVSERKALGYV